MVAADGAGEEMRSLQAIAVAEAVFGVLVVVFPAQIAALFLGADLPATLILAARVAGAGLILFALACLRYGLVRSLLTYSAAALVALVLIGVFAGQSGILLWPAVVAHLIAVIALTREVRAAR
jgi:drug/metabolite transporter (DMT)-like permease